MVAEEMLSAKNIPIIGRSTGGNNGRKIIFNTHTGEVLQGYIKSNLSR
jgi:chemotaxis receptor (MCP) glutamine deamidase CheD